MTRMGVTKRQGQLLTLLQNSEETPSYEEIKNALGLSSKSGVHALVRALEERGFIRRVKGRARAIQLIERPPVDAVEIRHAPCISTADTDALIAELSARGFLISRPLDRVA